jgi:hypothetical protein
MSLGLGQLKKQLWQVLRDERDCESRDLSQSERKAFILRKNHSYTTTFRCQTGVNYRPLLLLCHAADPTWMA